MKNVCIFPECGRKSPYSDGLCKGHHEMRRKAIPLRPIRNKPGPEPTHTGCSFDGCGREHEAKGLCKAHYYQQHKGKTLTPIRDQSIWSPSMFWRRTDKTTSCWVWQGPTVNSGYGVVSVRGTKWLAHRLAYTLTYGQIPTDAVVDHMCGNKLCVNPEHLRPLSNRDNSRVQGVRSNNKSGYRGVYWDASRQKWAAVVKVNGKSVFHRRFDSKEDAAGAVEAARAEIYGKPSPL